MASRGTSNGPPEVSKGLSGYRTARLPRRDYFWALTSPERKSTASRLVLCLP
jgi:hypothetical protein